MHRFTGGKSKAMINNLTRTFLRKSNRRQNRKGSKENNLKLCQSHDNL